jgi:hypothetical protein
MFYVAFSKVETVAQEKKTDAVSSNNAAYAVDDCSGFVLIRC